MESHPSCPKAPEPIKLGVFAYGEKGLTAGGFSRAPPNVLSDVLRQVPAPTARRLATDEWIKAQLQLWGITFNQSSSPAHLRSMLESAYRSGKVNFRLFSLRCSIYVRTS
ncbi:hypothetical protein BO70DRAFT_126466 [Aspergillus heteromorphus CBS 117.55]|uniref:Uncharacterized protein n=1 Tax=Aspergillus heteromorphus CBS 117.55 TaxID=1448321 RepID=A0A317VDM2_9EURO|nr:uncharacterized protein BO70DRAFT_126466 [Aspergillus heteromorphus CBS 117.55]PWY70992.1 hypothetical protein BO70DRAFT_126466 [Aspergillus heteromorphus CBS 117.55]